MTSDFAQVADAVRRSLVQPLADRLRWWTGVQFFDACVALLFAARAGFALHVASLVACVSTGSVGSLLQALGDGAALAVSLVVVSLVSCHSLPPARAFACAARRDPFLARDPRYLVEPSRSGLAAVALVACFAGAGAPGPVAGLVATLSHGCLHGAACWAGHAWWRVPASLCGELAACLACSCWGIGILFGGCERSSRGVRPRRRRAPRVSAAPSPS